MVDDYGRIECAIRYLEEKSTAQPELAEVAKHIGLSPFHFQRLFRRWAGISPKRFLQYLTISRAKKLLRNNHSVLDTTNELGLSSPGRLHDHFISIEAVAPGEFKNYGEGLILSYRVHRGPFGDMLVTRTSRGICSLSFISEQTLQIEIDRLRQAWPKATLREDKGNISPILKTLFNDLNTENAKFNLAVHGTNFQINVWKALLKIPFGFVTSYQMIADELGITKSVRAVANAIASNPVAYLIPCHRVLRRTGELGGYRWGITRKRTILAWEAAKWSKNEMIRM